MSDKILENHQVVSMEHELRVSGQHLSEKKTKTVMDDKTIIMEHTRTIDGKWYKVTETRHGEDDIGERKVETEMTEDEVNQFAEEWSKLWNPELLDQSIERFHV